MIGGKKSDFMKEYDIIVIGSGSGMEIVEKALSQGLKVALVDKGPLGGTCLNVGCIPSKMLIYPADRIAEIQEAKKLGINADIKSIDFDSIMKRMRKNVKQNQSHMKQGIKQTKNLDFYDGEGHFVDDYILKIKNNKIKGKKIFIVSGARLLVPPIKGIDNIDYLTNENVLELEKRPKSIIMIGGGYIAAEYGHFFASMGTEVTILGRNQRLVPNEEPEVSDLLRKKMQERMKVYTNTEAVEVKKENKEFVVVGKDRKTGKQKQLKAEKVMMATGRKSNADLLKVKNTGLEIDKRGFIKVNDYLETSKPNIWAFGDAIGKHMFKHVANAEAEYAWHNSIGHHKKMKFDYSAVPYAIFSHPQIAGVGMTQEQAQKKHKILVGAAKYSDVAKGEAMMEQESFAKAIVDKETGKILGFHIMGPYAPILIQEVVNTMANKQEFISIGKAMHIHPALPEIILEALSNLKEVKK